MAKVPPLHILVVVWGFLEILLFGGVIFGWHSVVYVYKDEGYFADLCDVSNVSVTQHVNNISTAQFVGNTSDVHRVSITAMYYTTLANSTGRTPSHWNNATAPASGLPPTELSCDDQLKLSESGKSKACAPQDEQFSLIFSLSTLITGLMCVINGYLYDRFGTRFCRWISITCYVIGFVCQVLASPENPFLLYPGYILQCYAGYFLLVTNMQLGGLIPHLRSTLISMCSGSFDSSAAIFLLFKVAHEQGIKINYCFVFQVCLFVIVIISTVIVHRKSHFPWPLPPDYKFRYYNFSTCQHFRNKKERHYDTDANVIWRSNENGSMMIVKKIEEKSTSENRKSLIGDKVTNDEKCGDSANGLSASVPEQTRTPTMLEVMKTPLFIWNLMWMCFQRLRSWFFVGMFNVWMTRLACGDKAIVSQYTSFFASVQFIGIFTSPMSGRLMDRRIPAAKIYNSLRMERLHASLASFLMCSGLSLVFTILVAIPILPLQYVSCILHSVCRSFIYGPNFAFAANAYPLEHFGKATGVILTVSAIFGMLQYPLFLLIQGPLDNNPLVVDILFITMMVVSFGHPMYIWNYLRKQRRKIEKETG
ncbi:solute carrier family 43 member 3-like [Haliotis rubra]|uniref:solute carrier family 43 member 3-like n=1 Tax=Haliotis rubra TaxID=36100 RepID=UPI001EE60DAC|nr:solute carrier family 43 member 3-like [Haliotis rubra]